MSREVSISINEYQEYLSYDECCKDPGRPLGDADIFLGKQLELKGLVETSDEMKMRKPILRNSGDLTMEELEAIGEEYVRNMTGKEKNNKAGLASPKYANV